MSLQQDKNHRKITISIVSVLMVLVVIGVIYTRLWGSIYDAYRYLRGIGGVSHSYGIFSETDGNPGHILFGAKPTDGYSGAHLFIPEGGDQVLTGSFWIETIGWVSLEDIDLMLTDTGAAIWTLSGYGWSSKAGWVDFADVTYHLSNTSFSGYAWNSGIGWIDMAGSSLDLTSSGAIGKVKIIGNIGGDSIYNTTYIADTSIKSAKIATAIDTVRKNIAILTRNIPDNLKNITLETNNIFSNAGGSKAVNNTMVFENTSPVVARVNYSSSIRQRFQNLSLDTPIYSVIAIGADIYIDDSVIPEDDGQPRALIAIQNEQGVGGNIYINGAIVKINSTLIAEGSVYSGEFPSGTTPTIYNDDVSSFSRIPNRQLYIYGSVVSRNTIGGYGPDNGISNFCPYGISPCDDSQAFIHDFNHFRDFQKSKPEGEKSLLRGYKDDRYDDYSLVIEYDPRILSSPPPGL